MSNTPTADNLVGIQALAQNLGMSDRTIRRHVSTGRIPHYRVGAHGKLRFDVGEVRAALRMERAS